MFDIDYVFPFVDGNEKVWKQTYINYCNKNKLYDKLENIEGSRFKDFGLLPTLIQCIKTNMPWIRKIHIIVSNIEQLPSIIREDTKVNIVLHKDIIPQEFLPTFNSTTIEMFIHNIEGLSEHFIYGNDDMYPISKLQPNDFFSEDGSKIKVMFKKEELNKFLILANQFRKVCWNNTNTIIKEFNINIQLKEREYFRPYHSISPMIKSQCKIVFDKCKNKIYDKIRAFRTSKQHNQYIYLVYLYLNNLVEDSPISFKYVSCKNTPQEIIKCINDRSIQILCVNDTPNEHRRDILNNKQHIVEAFNKRLSNEL